MKKISLFSNWVKIVSVIECLFTTALWYCACFLVDDLIIGGIIHITLVVLFCLFVLYISFFSKIIIKNDKLIIIQFKKIELNLKDIIDIYTDGYLIFFSTISKTYKIPGYRALLGWKYNESNTKRIVQTLNAFLKKYNKHY